MAAGEDFDPFGLKEERASRGPAFSWTLIFYIPFFLWTAKWGWEVWCAQASRSWPTVRGVISRAETPGAKKTGILVEVRYRPPSTRQDLVSTRIRFGLTGPTDEIRSRYMGPQGKGRVGEEIAVRYNPRRPSVSVLEPGLHWNGVGLEALYLFSAWYFALVIPQIISALGPFSPIPRGRRPF